MQNVRGIHIKPCTLRHSYIDAAYLLIYLEVLWRACNLTAFIHSFTGPVVHLFASRHEAPEFNPQGGTYVKPGFSC